MKQKTSSNSSDYLQFYGLEKVYEDEGQQHYYSRGALRGLIEIDPEIDRFDALTIREQKAFLFGYHQGMAKRKRLILENIIFGKQK